MKRRAGKRTTSAEKSGFTSRVRVRVPAKSHGSLDTPDAAATSSRMGRMTNQDDRTQKNRMKDAAIAAISPSRTSTTRFKSLFIDSTANADLASLVDRH